MVLAHPNMQHVMNLVSLLCRGIPNVVKLLVLGAAAAGAVVFAQQQRGRRDDLPPRPQPKRKGLLG